MPPRFFSAIKLPRAHFPKTQALDGAAAQHVRVLRLAAGDEVTLFDSDPDKSEGEATAFIKSIDKKSVVVEISAWRNRSAESALNVALIQALAVGDKMDLIVQKAVELGATEIVPLRAARATLKLDAERAGKRVAHWNAVAVSACEQCGRNRVPLVTEIRSLDAALDAALAASGVANRRVAILHPEGGVSLASWASAGQGAPLAILVGPEGGFTDAEIAQAVALGATKVTFGPRVLRTETAGLAALAALQAVLGDLR
jgi:16S rRNA (uracil1498-N3)-methyltransferase